jgi:hypothetical protein
VKILQIILHAAPRIDEVPWLQAEHREHVCQRLATVSFRPLPIEAGERAGDRVLDMRLARIEHQVQHGGRGVVELQRAESGIDLQRIASVSQQRR